MLKYDFVLINVHYRKSFKKYDAGSAIQITERNAHCDTKDGGEWRNSYHWRRAERLPKSPPFCCHRYAQWPLNMSVGDDYMPPKDQTLMFMKPNLDIWGQGDSQKGRTPRGPCRSVFKQRWSNYLIQGENEEKISQNRRSAPFRQTGSSVPIELRQSIYS